MAGLFDMLDGAVARTGNKASQWGGVFDSVIDRYSDFLILGGILAYFSKQGDFGMTLLILIIVCGTFLISYVRARAELAIPKCAVGIMERPERILLLSAGSIFGFFHTALWILAITTHVTALHRIFHTRNVLRDAAKSASGELERSISSQAISGSGSAIGIEHDFLDYQYLLAQGRLPIAAYRWEIK